MILAALAAGDIDLVVGTHALFQDDVAFHDLALAIVDEQHRFGVHQRLALARKGDAVDLLVLTATPIPRTLVLTYFGDMDISELREKPAGRQKIDTRAVPLDRLSEVIDAVARALDAGRRVYWVCPLVEESESVDLAAAEERYQALQKRFGDAVDLVHGKMRGPDKDRAMARFAHGETRLLVATTVIEVGVDVPEASVMVIEHAERFGLRATASIARPHRPRHRALDLHSVVPRAARAERPRRGSRSCARPRTVSASPRRIYGCVAKATCSVRGKAAIPVSASRGSNSTPSCSPPARDDATLMLSRDPKLQSPRGEALRDLLYLFARDEAIRLLGAG